MAAAVRVAMASWQSMSPPRGGDSWKWSETENQSKPCVSANFHSLRISSRGPPMWPMWMPNFIAPSSGPSEFFLRAPAAEPPALAGEAGLRDGRARVRGEGGDRRHHLQEPLAALVGEERVGGESRDLAPGGAPQRPLDDQRHDHEQGAREREHDPERRHVDVV